MDRALQQAQALRHEHGPDNVDRVIFFLVIPVALAFLFSLTGIRLIAGMTWFSGLLYMLCHMFICWWSVSLGTWSSKRLLQHWQPAPLALCAVGFLLALVPSSWLFLQLGSAFAGLDPVFAANRAQLEPEPSLLAGFARWMRYSLPALILFSATVWVYRRAAGVRWLSYPDSPLAGVDAGAGSGEPGGDHGDRAGLALAGRLPGSRLDPLAEVIAIKAEQHYICVHSTAGRDLVRCRFRDLSTIYDDCDGGQVHRSWWVSFAQVGRVRRAGRSIELVMTNGLSIPVSLMHKNMVMTALQQRRPSLPMDLAA